jgi:hypothetical protein
MFYNILLFSTKKMTTRITASQLLKELTSHGNKSPFWQRLTKHIPKATVESVIQILEAIIKPQNSTAQPPSDHQASEFESDVVGSAHHHSDHQTSEFDSDVVGSAHHHSDHQASEFDSDIVESAQPPNDKLRAQVLRFLEEEEEEEKEDPPCHVRRVMSSSK